MSSSQDSKRQSPEVDEDELRDKLRDEFKDAFGGKKKQRTVEDALEEALANTKPGKPGRVNKRKPQRHDGGEWI